MSAAVPLGRLLLGRPAALGRLSAATAAATGATARAATPLAGGSGGGVSSPRRGLTRLATLPTPGRRRPPATGVVSPAVATSPYRGKKKKAAAAAAAAAADASPRRRRRGGAADIDGADDGGGGRGNNADSDEVDEAAIAAAADRMEDYVGGLRRELGRLRVDGAHAGLLDDVRVPAYGGVAPLVDLATVAVRDGSLRVGVHDPALVGVVDKAIRGAGLGLNPTSAGGAGLLVRVPRASATTRAEMVKTAARAGETARIAIRAARRPVHDAIRGLDDERRRKVLAKALERASEAALAAVAAAVTAKTADITTEE